MNKARIWWRRYPHPVAHMLYVHAFRRDRVSGGYISLCGSHTISRIQTPEHKKHRCRPPVHKRCAICDGREMALHGAEESLPEDAWAMKRGVWSER